MKTRTELSLSDEWETEQKLYDKLCQQYGLDPWLDVCANSQTQNMKCFHYFDFHVGEDALQLEWNDCICNVKTAEPSEITNDVWCNPPHSRTKAFVLQAHEQWLTHNINIIMLVPLQTLGRKYFNDIFDNYITPKKGIEWHRVQPRPVFHNPLQEKPENAKQEYIVIIWRRQEK